MQLNGIGSGHDAHAHQITQCMHEHTHFKKDGTISGGASSNAGIQSLQTESSQEGQLSLSAWMERLLGKGKHLLRGIWGSNETASSGEAGDRSGAAQILADIREESMADGISANVAGRNGRQPDATQMLDEHIRTPHTSQIAAAATAVTPQQTIQDNPYFSPAENIGGRQDSLWQKMRVRFRDAAGQLAGHLPKKFSGFLQTRNSFQAKQEQPKKDLRKHSRFRRDEVEIDCVLTDDSYLLDSYDRKGEYSRLSTRK